MRQKTARRKKEIEEIKKKTRDEDVKEKKMERK